MLACAQPVDHRQGHHGSGRLRWHRRLPGGEILREPGQRPIEGILRDHAGHGGKYAHVPGALAEDRAARPEADCHAADQSGARPVREPAENAPDTAADERTARPSTDATDAGQLSAAAAAPAIASAAHDDAAERAARQLPANAAAKYADAKSGSTAHAGSY